MKIRDLAIKENVVVFTFQEPKEPKEPKEPEEEKEESIWDD